MTATKLTITFFLLTALSCGQSTQGPKDLAKATIKSASEWRPGPQLESVESYIFGIYCGECDSHCATMYECNLGGNTNTVLVDSTDSYFRNDGKVTCNTPITDTKRFFLAQNVYKQIPGQFLLSAKQSERFGCPDCTDGCGIYFELRQAGKTKKFYIDHQTEKLPGDVKEFAEYLKNTLKQLNEKKI